MPPVPLAAGKGTARTASFFAAIRRNPRLDVVVNGDAERGGDLDDRFRHLDIGLRGRGIATWMVVHQQTQNEILSKKQ
jgi:hypothetical protein